MKSKNLIVLTLIATVLCCGAFVSLAAADNISSATAPPYDPKATPNPDQSVQTAIPLVGSPDNSTGIPPAPDNDTYHILADQTAIGNNPEPGSAEGRPNLVATPADVSADNTLAVIAVATVVAAVLGAVGVVFYRKQAAEAES